MPDDVVVHIQVGDPVEFGAWCDECLKPAAIIFPLHAVSEVGVASIGSATYCPDCHPLGDDDDDEAE